MEDEILYQGAGYTIARSTRASTSVPYSRAERPNEDINHGWIDLRDRPDLVDSIPETQKSAGLARVLRAIATPGSPIMSSACECAAFSKAHEGSQRWHVGGFVITMFRDTTLNVVEQNLVELAGRILSGIGPSQDHLIAYELVVEPLRAFFGRKDCFALELKAIGFGDTEPDAWRAFDIAAAAAADSIVRLIE